MISNCTMIIIILFVVLLLTNEDINRTIEKFIDTKKCSYDCCNFTQYKNVTKKNNFKESRYTCYGGCPCLTENDINILSLRGYNT